ncbi:MAG: hypothetical protein WC366_02285 [Bacilli bacterium]|jgi:hypothetical protein
MKKINILPLLALALISITSVGCSNAEKVHLNYGTMISGDLVDIATYGNLESKIKDEENFAVVVYTKSGCSCWSTFEHMVLEKFNEENHTLIYKINYNLFFNGDESLNTYGLSISNERVTIALFKDGKVQVQEMYDESNKIFKNLDEFNIWFDKNAVLPNMFFVNKAELDELYVGSVPFVIEFERATCPDCAWVNSHGLKYYSTNNDGKEPVYIFDVDEVRLDDQGEIKTAEWNAFKDEYGLSSTNNAIYGYDTGFVPTFYYVEPNGTDKAGAVIKSGSVFVNDTISLVDNQYRVTKSYYTEERKEHLAYLSEKVATQVLSGLILTAEDVTVYPQYNNYVAWNYTSAEQYHNPLLWAFLDYYL